MAYDESGKYSLPPLQPFKAVWEGAVPEVEQYCADHDAQHKVDVEAEPAAEVPFRVQEWLFEELASRMAAEAADLLDVCPVEIRELARDRFRRGFARYGSSMYGWSPEERRRNVLEELADAVVYLTSGPIE